MFGTAKFTAGGDGAYGRPLPRVPLESRRSGLSAGIVGHTGLELTRRPRTRSGRLERSRECTLGLDGDRLHP